MDVSACRLSIARYARVVPRMVTGGASDEQRTRFGGPVGSDVHPTISVVVHHAVVVVPEHVDRWLSALQDRTDQAKR